MTDDYDAADNARKCYDVAIAAMREKLNGFRQERIGDCWLINADCREVLPLLPKVDAVVYNDLHEKSAIWKPKTGGRSGGDLGKSQADDCGPVCKRGLVATGIGDGIRLLPTGGCQGTPPHGDTFEITGAGRGSERQIHRRNAEHDLSNHEDGTKTRVVVVGWMEAMKPVPQWDKAEVYPLDDNGIPICF